MLAPLHKFVKTVTLVFALIYTPAWGLAFGSLSLAQRDQLKKGDIILVETKKKGAPWPEYTAHLLIEATALESIAVFAAFEHQQHYIPGLISSTLAKDQDNNQKIVDYEINVPWPFSNATYSNAHQLKRQGENYYLSWKQVRGSSTKENNGSAVFIPQEGNKTLMIYNSFIWPDSALASFIKSMAKKDLLKTLSSIRAEIHRIKKQDRSFLQKQIAVIQSSLAKDQSSL